MVISFEAYSKQWDPASFAPPHLFFHVAFDPVKTKSGPEKLWSDGVSPYPTELTRDRWGIPP
jgi:hypothetical protein